MDSPSLFVFSGPLLRYFFAFCIRFDRRRRASFFAMEFKEPARKRRFSPVWEHFEQISPQKVKCLVCSKVLSYNNNNTSTMLRHFRVLHGNEETNQAEPSSADKVDLAELLLDMVIEDSQPFTLVDGSGFKKLMKALAPSYILPTRQTLKAMVEKRYKETKDKTKAIVAKASACSLTSDMWTSINTDAYLAVTCHFIDETTSLQSVVLGVQHFPEAHTAANMASMKTSLMSEWGISEKVTCLVTDGAANMGACARELHMRHTICVAHTLNLLVKKALDQCPELFHIRTNCRKIVGYFKSSTTAKVSSLLVICNIFNCFLYTDLTLDFVVGETNSDASSNGPSGA
ncbi:E3 SUMO-protein ligase ZBED1-like isoform X1 [Festucalex cinctus]